MRDPKQGISPTSHLVGIPPLHVRKYDPIFEIEHKHAEDIEARNAKQRHGYNAGLSNMPADAVEILQKKRRGRSEEPATPYGTGEERGSWLNSGSRSRNGSDHIPVVVIA